MPTWPSPRSERLGTPNDPAIRFARGTYFGASWFTHLLRPVRLLAPLYGSDWNAQPTGASTSRLSTDRSPSPLLDMTTTATGLLCWRDFHPLEWQLASLHQIRTCSFPAYGSHLGYPRQIYAAVCEPASLTCLSSTEPGACVADPHSPWSPPFAPPTPRRIAPLCSSASQLLWRSATSRARTSSATVPRLPDADRPSHATLTASHEISQLPTRSFLRVMWPSTPAGRTVPRITASHMLRSTMKTVSAPASSSFRGSLPHPTQPLCTLRVRRRRRLTQHSLPGSLLGVTWAGLAPAERASFAGAFLHSITSSARASSVGGTSSPSAFAVLRLKTSSNLLGCSTGISPGFVPRKILST